MTKGAGKHRPHPALGGQEEHGSRSPGFGPPGHALGCCHANRSITVATAYLTVPLGVAHAVVTQSPAEQPSVLTCSSPCALLSLSPCPPSPCLRPHVVHPLYPLPLQSLGVDEQALLLHGDLVPVPLSALLLAYMCALWALCPLRSL